MFAICKSRSRPRVAERRGGDVVWQAEAAQRNMRSDALLSAAQPQCGSQLGLDVARRQRVDAHVGCQLEGELARGVQHRCLGRGLP